MVHYINAIVLIGPSQQEEATPVDIANMENKIQKVQGPSTSVKFPVVQSCGGRLHIPSKVKNK